jgi:hypothetical protein
MEPAREGPALSVSIPSNNACARNNVPLFSFSNGANHMMNVLAYKPLNDAVNEMVKGIAA